MSTVSPSLSDRYRQMPHERLMQIALHEAAGLTPEARAALDAELQARGAGDGVRHAVEAQTQGLAPSERDLLAAAIQRLACPDCGRTDRLLNGGVVARARSFVLFTTDDRETVIACPDCRAARATRALWTTALLGWWGFPWGPVQSVRALRHDVQTLRQRDRREPTPALLAWVTKHPGAAVALASEVQASVGPNRSTSAGWIHATDSR